MEYYIDIQLKPDAEMQESPLMNLVYEKLHKVLVKLKAEQIGVSFPKYKIKLGKMLRLHGNKNNLQNLAGNTSCFLKVASVRGGIIYADWY